MKKYLLTIFSFLSVFLFADNLRLIAQPPSVPEPIPVSSDFDISAFIYPGVRSMENWELVRSTRPDIKPVLGWYNEGNPEVIDWQIKWALEAGINVLFVDWYMNRGVSIFDHWINGFLQSQYHSRIRWAVHWANHYQPGAHSEADQRFVTQYWLDNYFHRPEYYKIDGKPVVLIWNPDNLDRDFIAEAESRGDRLAPGEGVRRALEISRAMAKEAGYPGIHFIALYHNAGIVKNEIKALADAGFDEWTVYSGFSPTKARYIAERLQEFREAHAVNRNSPGLDSGDSSTEVPGSLLKISCLEPTVQEIIAADRFYPYEKMTYITTIWWESALGTGELPFLPVIPTGWDETPRTFDREMAVNARTPEKFRAICEAAKNFCQANGLRRLGFSALNEWEEGSYIEPNQEFGFQMYETIREVFGHCPESGWPVFHSPMELGYGPYNYPEIPRSSRTTWEFNDDPEGWYRHPCGGERFRAQSGSLHFSRVRGDIPAIQTQIQPFPANQFSQVVIRMKITAENPPDGKQATFYWGNRESPIFHNGHIQSVQCVTLPVVIDDQFHDYIFDLSQNAQWRDTVDHLWFDPINLGAARVEIDFIRFQ